MNLNLPAIFAQTALLLLLAPLLSGLIRNWKAKLQNRRGPPIWQPYADLVKFLRATGHEPLVVALGEDEPPVE